MINVYEACTVTFVKVYSIHRGELCAVMGMVVGGDVVHVQSNRLYCV